MRDSSKLSYSSCSSRWPREPVERLENASLGSNRVHVLICITVEPPAARESITYLLIVLVLLHRGYEGDARVLWEARVRACVSDGCVQLCDSLKLTGWTLGSLMRRMPSGITVSPESGEEELELRWNPGALRRWTDGSDLRGCCGRRRELSWRCVSVRSKTSDVARGKNKERRARGPIFESVRGARR